VYKRQIIFKQSFEMGSVCCKEI